jgi:hypothetical protein
MWYKMVDFMNALASYQPRAANSPTSGFQDCDINHPAEIFCFIRNDVPVARIILTCFSRPFRATATGAASGGASVQTSSSTSTATGSHDHSVTVDWEHYHRYLVRNCHTNHPDGPENGYCSEPLAWNGSNYVTHTSTSVTTGANTNHAHDVPITVNIPQHEHQLLFGIFEYPYYAGVELFINQKTIRYPTFGVQGSESTYFDCALLELTQALHAPNGLEEGVNMLYLKPIASPRNPLGLIRIFSEVMVQYKE